MGIRPLELDLGLWQRVSMHSDRAVARIAVRQGGVIRSGQAAECGFTRGQIDQRVRDGRWTLVGRFGYRIVEMDGLLNLVRAAVATLPNAVVSHEAAAEIHDFPKMPTGIASVSVHSRTTHEFPDVIVHRCHDLDTDHIVQVSDVPITSIPRTVVDLSARLTTGHLAAVLSSLITERRVVTAEVQTVVDRVARRGKPGIRKIRTILDERDSGPRDGTPLERLGAEVLRTRGVSEPLFEFPMPWDSEKRFDAAYPDAGLGIEWDSRKWHELEEAFSSDRERDRKALLHGWRVVRFTWSDVTQRPDEVAETVRQLLLVPRLK
jgi:very-short-patch-repair endonuclease